MAVRTWIGTTSGDFSVSTNWVEGVVPTDGDDVYFSNNAVSVSAGLAQSSIELASLTIDASYTGSIGTSTAFLEIDATTVHIGRKQDGTTGSGSGRIKLDGIFSTVNVYDSAQSGSDSNLPPIQLKGTLGNVYVKGGRVGLAVGSASQTATATLLNVTKTTSAAVSPVVTVGGGVTVTSLLVDDGTVYSNSGNAVTTTNVTGGEYNVSGTGAHTTVTVNGGRLVYSGTGTITTLTVGSASADFSQDNRPKTVTNCDLQRGATLKDENGVVTYTNGIDINSCDLDAVTVRLGYNRRLTVGTAA